MSPAKAARADRPRKKKRRPPASATATSQKSAAAPERRSNAWWIAPIVALGLLGVTIWAWPPRPAPEPHVTRGNELFGHHAFREALGEYESAPGAGARNAGVQLDRGLARYRIALPPPDGGAFPMLPADAGAPEGYERAQEEMRTAVRGGTSNAGEDVDASLRAHAAYDLGNTFFSQHHWDNAIDEYKEALRLRPGWREAAWNLELARRLRELERTPPDAGPPDAGQDASQDSGPPDARDSGSDASDSGDSGGNDGSANDSGADSGAPNDSGQGDSGSDSGTGDSGGQADSGTNSADSATPQGDAGAPTADAAPPRSLAPLDDLDRTTRSLQNELLRRRGIVPRSPDEDK